MKKWLAILLSICMLTSVGVSTAACGKLVRKTDEEEEETTRKKKKNKESDETDESSDETESEPTDSIDDPTTDTGTDDSGIDFSKDFQDQTSPLEGPRYPIEYHEYPGYSYVAVEIEEQEIWNSDGLVITVTGYKIGSGTERNIVYTVENKTGHTVKLSCDYIFVNNYAVVGMALWEIEDGETEEIEHPFYDSLGNDIGFWEAEQIDVEFEVKYDGELAYETPRLSFQTSLYDGDLSVDLSYGTLVFDDGQIRITAYNYYIDRWGDSVLAFEFVNYTDKQWVMHSNQLYLNGVDANDTAGFFTVLQPNCRQIVMYKVSEDKLAELKVPKIKEISIQWKYNDLNDYTADEIQISPVAFIVD